MTQPRFTVDLVRSGRPERIAALVAIAVTQLVLLRMYGAGVVADAAETLSRHSSRWILVLAVLLQTLVIAGAIRLLRRRTGVLTIDDEGLTFRGTRIAFTAIVRLGFYQPLHRRGIAGWYSVEAQDGRVVRFEVHPRDHSNRLIGEALEFIEQRARRRWIGRGESRSGSFGEFIGALRRGTGGRLWSWIGRSSFTIQSHSGELNDPVYRWTTPLFYIPLVAVLLTTMYILTPGARLHYGTLKMTISSSSGLLPVVRVLIVLLILGWIFTALGVNALVLLMRTQTRRRETLQAELNAAREVQFRLLPAHPPRIEGFETSAICIPALDVGGDYYDFATLPNGRTAIAIADVAGKGLSAALLMTMLKGCLTTALQRPASLSELAAALDRTLRQSSPDRTFVTMILVEVDPGSGNIHLVRAGHTPPLLLRAGGNPEFLCPAGPALGMRLGGASNRVWQSAEVAMKVNDVLVLYTDGVTEEMNDDGEQFGSNRLATAVSASNGHSAEEIRAKLVADVQAFRGTKEASDDLTLVVLRRA